MSPDGGRIVGQRGGRHNLIRATGGTARAHRDRDCQVMIDTVDQDESDREIESAAETNQRFRLVDDHPH
jgi:hypothetical protein